MNTELLRRILDDARDNAATPSLAMEIEDLARDLETLDAIDAHGVDFDEVPTWISEYREVVGHVKRQPFDVTTSEEDEEGYVRVAELTPGAFTEWLAELERLAQ